MLKSGAEGDLGSGFVMIEPHANYAIAPDSSNLCLESYAQIGADPFNRQLTALLREHGCRDAVHLPCGGGVSLLDRYLVVPQPRHETISPAALVPVARGEINTAGVRVNLPPPFDAGHRLTDLLSGAIVPPDDDGSYTFSERGIYRIG